MKNIMKNRFSCRKYKDEKISDEVIKEILDLTRLSPSSVGLEPWKFMVVSKKQDLQDLSKACFNQSQVANCSHAIIIFSRKDLRSSDEYPLKRIDAVAKTPEKKESYLKFLKPKDLMSDKELENYANLQCYLAAANLVNIAFSFDVKSCIIGGFEKDKVANFAGLGDNFNPCLVISLGYSDEKASEKIRQSLEEVVIFK